MIQEVSFSCPLNCGFSSPLKESLISHLNNRCPKRVLLGSDFTYCLNNPESLIKASQREDHCDECALSIPKNLKQELAGVRYLDDHVTQTTYSVNNPQNFQHSPKYKDQSDNRQGSFCQNDSMIEYSQKAHYRQMAHRRNANDTMVLDCSTLDTSYSIPVKNSKHIIRKYLPVADDTMAIDLRGIKEEDNEDSKDKEREKEDGSILGGIAEKVLNINLANNILGAIDDENQNGLCEDKEMREVATEIQKCDGLEDFKEYFIN